jgi:hypothetical protein
MMVPFAGNAAVTAKDMQVAARILSFSDNPPTGNIKLGIVYDPANAASAADEQTLVGILGSGLLVGNINLLAVPVSIGNIGSTPVDVLFLTAGLGAEGAKVRTQDKTLCMTTDLSATKAGYCAINIQTTPSVQITVNKAAASTAGNFASAFLMMVTEI